MKKWLDNTADKAIQDMHKQNADNALQAAIELMLTDRPTKDVILALDAWSSYLEERI